MELSFLYIILEICFVQVNEDCPPFKYNSVLDQYLNLISWFRSCLELFIILKV